VNNDFGLVMDSKWSGEYITTFCVVDSSAGSRGAGFTGISEIQTKPVSWVFIERSFDRELWFVMVHWFGYRRSGDHEFRRDWGRLVDVHPRY
jgi:hypothetical protein